MLCAITLAFFVINLRYELTQSLHMIGVVHTIETKVDWNEFFQTGLPYENRTAWASIHRCRIEEVVMILINIVL